jgi:hypothetical protein
MKSEGDVSSGSESLELFQPSSPFRITEEFILPDILEESEELDADTDLENAHEHSMNKSDLLSIHSSLDDGEFDIKVTNFNDEQFFDDTGTVEPQSANPEKQTPDLTPPVLPISPPPGPLLPTSPPPGPLISMETPLASNKSTPPEEYNPVNFRRSVAGALEDLPPPLPTTLPPGKLISPRHSSGFLDLAELSVSTRKGSRGHLDMSQLVLEMKRVSDETKQEPQVDVGSRAKCKEEDTPKGKHGVEAAVMDDVLSLVPPIQNHPEEVEFDEDGNPSMTRHRLGSYHLKTFEPPQEFSDSGFQDTDNAAAPQGSKDTTTEHVAASEGRDATSPSILVTSIASRMSDEQLTENSGSVELKTFASSGSEVSPPSSVVVIGYIC